MNRASWGRLAKAYSRISGTDYQDQRLIEHLAFGHQSHLDFNLGSGEFTGLKPLLCLEFLFPIPCRWSPATERP
jgi:hypothetical protein